MTRIAHLGLGIMGRGMVRNLRVGGHDVTGWNRSAPDLPSELLDLSLAPSISAAVTAKDVVTICLTGPDAQRAVLMGDDGVLCHAPVGTLIIDATTTDPELAREIGAAAADRGLRYVDAPVFGSRGEAWDGRLDFICGGSEKDVADARPVLESMAATIHHLGPVGAGAAAKLVGNLLVAAQLVSLGEALALARKSGLPDAALMGFLDVTDYSSALIRGVGRNTLAGDFSPHFYLRHMLKDARLITDHAHRLGVSVPMTAAAAEQFQAAVNHGHGDLNASGLHVTQFANAGLEKP
ncbi:NAD(P)-dependent oxidoreductase [Pseudotabrizicola sediminis]|nr:NAD(P)-dependent oxidoreductase [Pseudotabrizicola sediminis]